MAATRALGRLPVVVFTRRHFELSLFSRPNPQKSRFFDLFDDGSIDDLPGPSDATGTGAVVVCRFLSSVPVLRGHNLCPRRIKLNLYNNSAIASATSLLPHSRPVGVLISKQVSFDLPTYRRHHATVPPPLIKGGIGLCPRTRCIAPRRTSSLGET